MEKGWIWHQRGRRDRPRLRNGHASTLDEKKEVLRVRHVVGFAREDWGEANWTAKDLR